MKLNGAGSQHRMKQVRETCSVLVTVLTLTLTTMCLHAFAHDYGQWLDESPEVRAWYNSLRQPDHPDISCCGVGDSYWADDIETDSNGNLIAVITDDRADEPLKRPHIPAGTRMSVPKEKINWDEGNPSGHTVIFLGTHSSEYFVFCFVQNGSV